MLKRNCIYLILLLFAIPMTSFADVGPMNRIIDWNPLAKLRITDTKSVTELSFTGARYNIETASLPVYKERFIIGSINNELEAIITNQVWEDLNADIKTLKGFDLITSEIDAKAVVAVERKQAYAALSFIPLRKDASSGKYQKLVSFTVRIRLIEKASFHRGPANIYRQNSVLASGDWYKIAVQQTGVYKITQANLSSMGINTSSIDPRNIRIYGNGGGMLPEACDEPRYDDLMENAIFVMGESDGSFDQNDYILFYGESPDTWKWD